MGWINRNRGGNPQLHNAYSNQNNPPMANLSPQNAHIHQNNPSFANFSPQTHQYYQNYAPNANPSPQYTYQNYTPHAHLPPQPIRTAQQSAAPINSHRQTHQTAPHNNVRTDRVPNPGRVHASTNTDNQRAQTQRRTARPASNLRQPMTHA